MSKKINKESLNQLLSEAAFPSTKTYQQEFLKLFYSYILKGKTEEALKGIASGIVGTHISIKTRITYVSDEPIRDFFPFPEIDSSANDLDAYITSYQNLIISVSSFDRTTSKASNKEFYEHRGIFRNPISMLC